MYLYSVPRVTLYGGRFQPCCGVRELVAATSRSIVLLSASMRDAVAVAGEGDGAAFDRLGGDVADDEAVAAAAEAAVGDQRDVVEQPVAGEARVGVSISGMPGPPLGPS